MHERAADALGQHDRVHSQGREKTGLVRVRDTEGQRGVNTLTGQPFRCSSPGIDLTTPTRLMQVDDDGGIHGGGRNARVDQV